MKRNPIAPIVILLTIPIILIFVTPLRDSVNEILHIGGAGDVESRIPWNIYIWVYGLIGVTFQIISWLYGGRYAFQLVTAFVFFNNLMYPIYASHHRDTSLLYQLERVMPELLLPFLAFFILNWLKNPPDTKLKNHMELITKTNALQTERDSLEVFVDDLMSDLVKIKEKYESLKSKSIDQDDVKSFNDELEDEYKQEIQSLNLKIHNLEKRNESVSEELENIDENTPIAFDNDVLTTATYLIGLSSEHTFTKSFYKQFEKASLKDKVIAYATLKSLMRFKQKYQMTTTRRDFRVRDKDGRLEYRVNKKVRIICSKGNGNVVFEDIELHHI
jgi:hypothetical protein